GLESGAAARRDARGAVRRDGGGLRESGAPNHRLLWPRMGRSVLAVPQAQAPGENCECDAGAAADLQELGWTLAPLQGAADAAHQGAADRAAGLSAEPTHALGPTFQSRPARRVYAFGGRGGRKSIYPREARRR